MELLELTASSELERLQGVAAELISSDEILHRLLSMKINSGPELDSLARAHLSRMIAIRSQGIFDKIVDTEQLAEFWKIAGDDVWDALAELEEFEQELADLPDLWTIAAEDLDTL